MGRESNKIYKEIIIFNSLIAIINYIRNVGLILILPLIGYLVNPLELGYLFGYLLFAIVIVKKDFVKQNLDFSLFLLTLFSIILALFYSFQADALAGKQYIAIYAVTPPIFYLLGKYLVRDHITSLGIFYLLMTIAGLFSFSALLSVLLNFLEGGFAQMDRTIPNFWTGNKVSATVMASFFSLNMCIPGLLLADLTKKHIVGQVNYGRSIYPILDLCPAIGKPHPIGHFPYHHVDFNTIHIS